MKKINSILHDEKVQGSLIIAGVFIAIAILMILTWDK